MYHGQWNPRHPVNSPWVIPPYKNIPPIRAEIPRMTPPYMNIPSTQEQILEVMAQLRDDLEYTIRSIPERPVEVVKKFHGKREYANIETFLNPLHYAWEFHEQYIRMMPDHVNAFFVGMNPSPQSQSGLPFYDEYVMEKSFGHHITMEDEFTNITSESGKRFWDLMLDEFDYTNDEESDYGTKDYGPAIEEFFDHCFVINCCPMIFLDSRGKGVSVDGFRNSGVDILEELMFYCDVALENIVKILNPDLVVGIGRYAWNSLKRYTGENLIRIRHPSSRADVWGRPWVEGARDDLDRSPEWTELLQHVDNLREYE